MIAALGSAALVLHTPRLTLRPLAPEDEDIQRALLTDPVVTRYVTDPLTPSQVARRMVQAVRRGAGGRIGAWTVSITATGERIGDGALTPVPFDEKDTPWHQVRPDAWPENPVEVGYMLLRHVWGQGYATEICESLLRFAFERAGLEQVVACADPYNAASRRVLCKCGMRDCGPARAYGEMVAWFEMSRADWEARVRRRNPRSAG